MSFELFNNSTLIKDERIRELVSDCIKNKNLPDFYLSVSDEYFDGVTTNASKPAILLVFRNLTQFKRVLRHELVHLRQHQEGYSNEEEANKAEVDEK